MRRVLVACAALVLVGGLSAPANATTPTITVQNMAFSPRSLGIPLGSTVTFAFRDPIAHTTTSNQGFWNSGPKTNGHDYVLYVGASGTFSYHCAIHPDMTGSLTVMPGSSLTKSGVFVRWAVFPPPLASGVRWVGGTAFAVQYHLKAPGGVWVTWAGHTTLHGQYFHPPVHGYYAVRAFSWNGGVHSGWSPNATVHY